VAEFKLPNYKEVVVDLSLKSNTFGTSFGCHATSIANLSLGGYPFVVKDPNNELAAAVKVKTNQSLGERAGYKYIGDMTEVYKLLKEDPYREFLFQELAQKYACYSLIFMTCPCNKAGKPAERTDITDMSVAAFATWLKDRGEFIMASPLLSNYYHQTSSFSILRGWMWVPTHSADNVKHVEGTEYISGKMKSGVSLPAWKEHYRNYHGQHPLYGVTGGQLKDFDVPDLWG
jgi:hypothetical protein